MTARRGSSCAAVVAAVACMALGAGAGSAAAARSWLLPATPLAPAATGASSPAVAIDSSGSAVVVWVTGTPALMPGDPGESVLARTRPPGGSWSAPATVASGPAVASPSVAIDAAGNATAVWMVADSDLTTLSASAAQLDAQTGAWSAPHPFASVGPASSGPAPQVRVDGAGDAVAAWIEQDDASSNTVVRAAVRHESGGAWSGPTTISDAANDSVESIAGPQIALAATGDAIVAWTAQQVDDGSSHVQQAPLSATPSGGSWGAATDIVSSTTDFITPVQLAGDGAGGAVASWFIGNPAQLQAAVWASGVWVPADISSDVAPACTPQSALGEDANDSATVMWNAASTGGIAAATFDDPSWGTQTDVYTPPASESVLGVQLAERTALFATADSGSGNATVRATSPAGAGWATPTPLASTSDGSSLSVPAGAIDAAGDALAAWTLTDTNANGTIAAASFEQPPSQPTTTTQPPPTQPQATTTAKPIPHPAPRLLPPLLVVRNATFRLGRSSSTLAARLVNRDAVALRGSATLAAIPPRHHRAATLAVQRHVSLRAHGRPLLHLTLSSAALTRLRTTRGHRLAVRLSLTVRAPNGHLLRATARYTLDATARYGKARPRTTARGIRRLLVRAAC